MLTANLSHINEELQVKVLVVRDGYFIFLKKFDCPIYWIQQNIKRTLNETL